MATLKVRHLKGCTGTVRRGVVAHPTVAGRYYFVAGKMVVCGTEGDPNTQFIMHGHDDSVTALACSNQGNLLATGQSGQNSDVVIWDLASLQPKYRFQEHDFEVCQLAYSMDDRLLATLGNQRDRKIFILDNLTGKIVSTGQWMEPVRPTAAAWSPQTASASGAPSYLLASATDSTITLWSLDPVKGTLTPEHVVMGSVRRAYTALIFSANGQWLFAGTTSGDVVTVNVARKAVQMVHPLCSGGVGGLQLLSETELLVAGGDGGLYRFNMEQMRHEATPTAVVPGSITSLSRIAGSAGWLVGCANGSIHRVVGNKVYSHMTGHTAALRTVAFNAQDPSMVATGGDDASICIWNLQDYSLTGRISEPRVGPALCMSVSSSDIVSGWSDGFIRCHSRTASTSDGSCQPTWVIPGAHALAHSVGTTALKRSSHGHFMVTGGAGGEIRVWDLRTRGMTSHLKLHHQPITALEVLADDAHVLAACHDRSTSLWDLREEKIRVTFRCPTAMVLDMAVAPDQVQMVTVGNDKRITFWDIRQPEPTRVISDAHAGDVASVALNRAGSLLATGGADAVVKLWDFRGTALLSQAKPHSGTVNSIAFSPSERQIVSAAQDATVAVLDVL